MKLNKFTAINPQYNINKAEIKSAISTETIKVDDKNKGTRIVPYVSVNLCDSLILQNVLLKTSIEVLSEDVILNDFTYSDEDNVNEKMVEFWKNNITELNNQIIDYFSYGFGASEITFNELGEPVGLYQIPANTLYIKTERNPANQEEVSHYAVQQVNGVDTVKMRLSHLEYDEVDKDLPVCFWIGKGRKSDFFDYPIWISAFNHVSASVSLDMLNAEKISDGNLISGILTVIKPPMNPNDDTVEETLEEKMQEKGSGVFTLELTTFNPEIPLKVDYIQISESNYQYLSELASKCDDKILAVFKVPKVRLMIDDVTESMNSNKSATIYEIYTIELQNKQRIFENKIDEFNKKFFEYDGNVDINTPIFSDKKEVEAQITLNLFNNGLITLGQAINKIMLLFPEYQTEEFNIIDNPVFMERYYNGNPLGLNVEDAEMDNPVASVGDLIDYIKIT